MAPLKLFGSMGVLLCHSLLMLHSSISWAANARLPAIRKVGTIPAQWQGSVASTSSLRDLPEMINQNYPILVRESRRFQMINDEITSHLWSSPGGREELRSVYELDAFVSLNVRIEADLMIWSCRLLSPRLDTYLLETERIARSWLLGASHEERLGRLRHLIFRTLNRYPIDVFVTSIQGRFITLSAGSDQNIFEGEPLHFQRFSVKSVHPATGAWLDIASDHLAEATVVDVKDKSSIAQLTSLAYESALKVGDGARVSTIASRRLFARLSEQPAWQETDQDSPILATNASGSQQIQEFPKSQPSKLNREPSQTENRPDLEPAKEEPKPKATEPTAEAGSHADQTGATPEENSSIGQEPPSNPPTEIRQDNVFDSMFTNFLDAWRIQAGSQLWNYSQGAAKASSSFPIWLFNDFFGSGRLRWNPEAFSDLGLGVGFGPTSNGSFTSFKIGGNYLQSIPLAGLISPYIEGVRIGGRARFETQAVTGETFGGLDSLEIGGLGEVFGQYHLIEQAETIEFAAGLSLDIFSFGQAGLGGTKQATTGLVAYGLHAEAILRRPGNQWQWGAFLNTRSGTYDNDRGSLGLSSFSLGVLLETYVN